MWRRFRTTLYTLPHTATHCHTLPHTTTHRHTPPQTRAFMIYLLPLYTKRDVGAAPVMDPSSFLSKLQQIAKHSKHTNLRSHPHLLPLALSWIWGHLLFWIHPPSVAHCSTLQHTATHCNTLRHTARHCNTLQDANLHFHEPPPSRRTFMDMGRQDF